MDQDDPEKRIADLERQVAEQTRGAGLPPGAPHHARPYSGSAPGLAQRRLLAHATVSNKQSYIFHFGFVAALFVLTAVIATLAYVVPAWRSILLAPRAIVLLPVWAIVFIPLLYFISAYLFRRRFARQIVICVTSDGLTVNQRPGEAFSFSDAELGAWDEEASGGSSTTVGTALHLQCGSHRFVLGAKDHRVTPTTPLEAPPMRSIDATMSAEDFEELLAIADLKPQLAERQPQQAHAAPETGSGSRKRSALASIVQFFAIFCAVGGLYFFPDAWAMLFANLLSTPTTATIDHCVPHVVQTLNEGSGHTKVDYETCYGRWSVGGVPQNGQIGGKFQGDRPVGSQVDVYVRGGRAYEGHPNNAPGILWLSGCFFAIATGGLLFWSARRKIKTSSWPWSGKRMKDRTDL